MAVYGTRRSGCAKSLRAFGAGQIICGCCLIVLDIIGLWTGLIYLISGALSIHAGRPIKYPPTSRNHLNTLIAAMSFNILSILCSLALSIPFAYAISNTYMFCVLDNAHCTLFALRCAYFGFSLMAVFASLMSSISTGICLCYKTCPSRVVVDSLQVTKTRTGSDDEAFSLPPPPIAPQGLAPSAPTVEFQFIPQQPSVGPLPGVPMTRASTVVPVASLGY